MVLVAAGLTACGGPEEMTPGYLVLTEGATLHSLPQQVTDAAVAMPHVAFELTSVEVSDTIEESYLRSFRLGEESFAPAAGEEFVLARLGRTEPSYPEGGEPTVTLVAGSAEHDVTEDLAPMAQEQALLLVSVPEGSAVQLEVSDEERSTTLDLRTGELGGDAVEATKTRLLPGAQAQLGGSERVTATLSAVDPLMEQLLGGDVDLTIGLDGATGSRHAWIKGPGWAPDGQAYLQISNITSHHLSGICSPQWSLPADAVTLTPDGGEPTQPFTIDNVGGGEMMQMQGTMVFHVPVDMTSAVLSLTPELSTVNSCEVSAGPDPSTVEFPIELA